MELSDLIRTIAGKGKPQNRTIEGAFFVQGVIEQVFASGGIMVNIPTGVVMAKPVTDEPFTKGTRVWVSSTEDKTAYLIHGAVR